MAHILAHPSAAPDVPPIRAVEAARPLRWLRRGWEDLARLRGHSLAYGLFVAGLGVLLLALAWGATYLVPAFIGGFLLVAPFAAIGLYALSRQRESGRRVDPAEAIFAWRANAGSIGLFALLLVLSLILWERVAAIVFALTFGGTVPDLSRLVADVLFSGEYLGLVAAFFAVGALLAAVVFTFSVVSVPMLLDRPVDVVTAAVTSLVCCVRNPGAMLLWAALIAGLTAIGFATLMIGLVLIFPWLGHASWHAYRDLVE